MIFIDRKIVRYEALAVAPAHGGIATCRDNPLDTDTEGGVMDVEGADDVRLVSNVGCGNIGIMNSGKVDDCVSTNHRFHDLAQVLNIAEKVFHGASFRPGRAV